MRNTKTDYVSCPSCGRTLFSLQEVTDQIRVRTGHLPGVAIAIMGCIVNGPGEMADAGELPEHYPDPFVGLSRQVKDPPMQVQQQHIRPACLLVGSLVLKGSEDVTAF